MGFLLLTLVGQFTNFQPAPEGTPFTQDGQWSVPLPSTECTSLPESAAEAIRDFVSIFLPEFKDVPFHSTKLCWYTDTLDNSFLVGFVNATSWALGFPANPDRQIDYVPTYADNSVFVCTGGSGHGAKFMPILGEVSYLVLRRAILDLQWLTYPCTPARR